MPLQLLTAEDLEQYRAAERGEQEAQRPGGEARASAEHRAQSPGIVAGRRSVVNQQEDTS